MNLRHGFKHSLILAASCCKVSVAVISPPALFLIQVTKNLLPHLSSQSHFILCFQMVPYISNTERKHINPHKTSKQGLITEQPVTRKLSFCHTSSFKGKRVQVPPTSWVVCRVLCTNNHWTRQFSAQARKVPKCLTPEQVGRKTPYD